MQIKSKIINANAGSGKTYRIIKRVEEIINAGNNPSAILCITFTNAGVDEMQERLQKECAHLILNEQPKIITFHSLCQEITAMFSSELGMPYEFEIMENIDVDFLESIVKNVLGLEAIKNLVRNFDISYEDIKNICSFLIEESYNIANNKSARQSTLTDVFRIQNKNTEAAKNRIYKDVLSTIPIAILQKLSGKSIDDALPKISQISSAEINEHTFWRYVSLILPLRNKEIKPYKEKLHIHLEKLKSIQDFAISLILNDCFNDILQIIEKRKKTDKKYTFDDIIQKALSILRNPELRDFALFKFGSSYKHILVDEAQDTNQDQWEIIKYLLEENLATNMDDGSLFIVGDVKQTIYGFQGAEAGIMNDVYLQYRDFLQQEYLTVSYRTTKPVLDLINAAFEIDKKQMHVSAFKDEAGSVTIVNSVKEPKTREEREIESVALANFIASEVQTLLGRKLRHEKHLGRKIEPKDIAILARSRNDSAINSLKTAFHNAGIPIAFNERIDYKTHGAVLDFISLLKLCIIEADTLSLYAALKSPIFNIAEEEFSGLFNKNTSIDDIFAKYPHLKQEIDSIKETLHYEGLTAFFYNIYVKYREKYTKQEAEILTRFIETTEKVKQFDFIKYIQNFEKAKQIFINKPQEENAVLFTTAHSAKGLQYPVVFYFETAKPQLGRAKYKTFTFHGAIIWRNIHEERSAIVQEIIERKTSEMQDEESRLQYVAVSRSEEKFYYVGNYHNTAKNEDNEPLNPNAMYHKLAKALPMGFVRSEKDGLQVYSYTK